MATLTVLDKKKVPVKGVAGGLMKPPTIDFNIVIDLDSKIAKEAFADKLLLKKFAEQADEILKMTVAMVENKIKVFEDLFKYMLKEGAPVRVVTTNMEGFKKAVQKDIEVAIIAAEQGCDRVWAELQAHRKEWKQFKMKTKAAIAASVATFAVSIAAMASSPFTGGAGSALAIIGFIKSSVKIVEDIRKLSMGFDKARDNLSEDLDKVESHAKSTGLYVANEISAAVLSEFLGKSQASLKSAQSAAGVMKAFYSKLVVDSHKLSKEVTRLETEAGKQVTLLLKEAEQKLKGVAPITVNHIKGRIEANYNKTMGPVFADIARQNAKLDKMYEKTKKLEPEVNALMGRMKALELKDPKGLKVFRETLKLATLGLAPLNGNELAVEAADLGMGLGGAIAGFTWDKASSKYFEGTIFDAA